jgi:hypothetical protein
LYRAEANAQSEVGSVPKFVTIGYGDQDGYDRTEDDLKARAHEHDAWLMQRGGIMGIAGPPVQVRNPAHRGVETEAGAFMRSELPIAGFALIEATDLEEAIQLVAETPCAIAFGVVEVWPLVET